MSRAIRDHGERFEPGRVARRVAGGERPEIRPVQRLDVAITEQRAGPTRGRIHLIVFAQVFEYRAIMERCLRPRPPPPRPRSGNCPTGSSRRPWPGQEVVLRRAYAELLRLLGEARRRGSCGGYADVRGLLAEELRLSAREIDARLADATATQASPNLAGEARSAPLAATGQALADGRIGAEHVRVIQQVFTHCPDALPDQERTEAEHIVLELAMQARPEAVRAAGRKLIACWQDEDRPPTDPPQREFRYRRNRGGEMAFSGFLDPETATTLEGLFGPLAKPRPADVDGHRDWRTREQRRGDAPAEIIASASRTDDLTVHRGKRAVLTVTISLEELESRVNTRLLDVPGLHQSGPAAAGGVRGRGRARRLRQRRPTTLPRSRSAARHQSSAPRARRTGRRLCPPWLRSETEMDGAATTFVTGPTRVAPTSTTWCSYARGTTGSCTTPSGKCGSTPLTSCPSSCHPLGWTPNEDRYATPHMASSRPGDAATGHRLNHSAVARARRA